MAPNNSQSLVEEITPHGIITSHEDMPEKVQHLPNRSVIPVSLNDASYLIHYSDQSTSEMDQRKYTFSASSLAVKTGRVTAAFACRRA
jgi:hypothetical protein